MTVSVGTALASSPAEIKEAFPKLELNKSLFTSRAPSSQVNILLSPYNHKPQAVGFNYKLDPNKRYLVSIVGQSYKIKPLLGIQVTGKPDRILHAPHGEVFYNVFNTAEVTLFLNIDPRIKYQLNSIQFHECPLCIDQKELTRIIRNNNPQLDILLKQDHLLAAQAILDWTANITPIALSKRFHDKTGNFGRMAPEEIYNSLNLNLAAVYCGGASLFFNKVLALFEINSLTVDFGNTKDFLTHTTVLVTKRSGNRWSYYIFDPTFNITFHNPSNGHFLTFSEMMNLSNTKSKKGIKVNQRSLHKRRFLISNEDAKWCRTVIETTPDYLICNIFDYSLEYYFSQANPLFVKNGYSKNLSGFLQLFRNRVFSVAGFSKHDSREQFVKILKTHDIPLGHGS